MRVSKSSLTLFGMVGLLTVSGIQHFRKPVGFDKIVPRALPGEPRTWTQISGAAELSIAAALAVPRTRSLGGLAAAALFVAVFPANIRMARSAWRSDRAGTRAKAITLVRLPLQIPLVLGAVAIRRGTRQPRL